jgi:hypothetical protein
MIVRVSNQEETQFLLYRDLAVLVSSASRELWIGKRDPTVGTGNAAIQRELLQLTVVGRLQSFQNGGGYIHVISSNVKALQRQFA